MIAFEEYPQAFVVVAGTGADIDFVAGDGAGMTAWPSGGHFPDESSFLYKRQYLADQEPCQLDVFRFHDVSVIVTWGGSFAAEDPVCRDHGSVFVVINKDVHGDQMVAAAPFPVVMVFIVAVVLNQELRDEKPLLFAVIFVQVFKDRVRVFDAGDAVVFQIDNVNPVIGPCHKTVGVMAVRGTDNGSLNAEALQFGFRGQGRRAYCFAYAENREYRGHTNCYRQCRQAFQPAACFFSCHCQSLPCQFNQRFLRSDLMSNPRFLNYNIDFEQVISGNFYYNDLAEENILCDIIQLIRVSLNHHKKTDGFLAGWKRFAKNLFQETVSSLINGFSQKGEDITMNKAECLRLLKKFEGSTLIKYCGLRLEDADCGWVKASMPVKEEITNPFGYIHGGVLNILIDSAGGIVCWTVGCKVCTLNLSTSYMGNVQAGHTVFAEASVVRKTDHVIFTEVKVYSDGGDVLAKGSAAMYIVGAYEKIPPRW